MNETQKKHVLSLLTKAWSDHNISPIIEKGENDQISKILFQHNGKNLIEPLCWCSKEGCFNCELTRAKEEDERIRCRFSCDKLKKCYLCV